MTKRKTLARFGRRGDEVRALVDAKRDRVIVHYRDGQGIPRRKFFTNSAEGRTEAAVWAQAYHGERARQSARKAERTRLTLRQLWQAYLASPAWDELRPRTKINYAARWKKWEEFHTPDAFVDDTTLHHVDKFRTAARKTGMAMNQIRNVIAVARIVYNWGQSRKLLTTNDLALFRWKQPKDAEVLEPEEYTLEEFDKLLRQFDPTKTHGWRPWVALMLAGHEGQRANAVLHLRWSDVDFEGGRLLWPAAFQKQGKELDHPITFAVLSALITARIWREKLGVQSDWILPAARKHEQPFSYTSFHYQLMTAERSSGVGHKPYRAAHGFRRMVVGDVGERSGDRMLGLEYVGDTDPKMLKRYDKRGPKRIAAAAALIEEGK